VAAIRTWDLDVLGREALDAARDLTTGDSALAGVLRDLEQERSRATQAYHAVLRSLAAALEARDGYTGEHSDDVRRLAAAVASRLGLEERATAEVEAVALLHDVGKIGVPDGILHKPGPLTPPEWELMREHPVIGERILRPHPGMDAIATAVRHEHERWDGGGYPDGLGGETIPLASRIVLACDAYHALVTDRPYRARLGEEAARAELLRCAGTQFDPRVVDALLAALAAPDPDVHPGAGAEEVASALTAAEGDEHRRRLERELIAIITIAGAVGAAHRIEDVVEIAADHAREAIGAASLSISRWEVQGRLLRTVVNVGELGPGEERFPADERYRLDEHDSLRAVIEHGRGYRWSLDDPDVHPMERTVLERLGKQHCAGVGIRFAGLPWGEVWASRRADQPPFTERDVRFLHTVSGLIAAAAGRAEVFSRMAELAYKDPLTGVANRRALEERLEVSMAEALDAGDDLALLLCDLDGLKELNDVHGHQAGDAALGRVAAALAAVAGDGLVARVGGDEFCVLLEGRTADDAQHVGDELLARLAGVGEDGVPALTASCGIASIGLGARRPGELLRAADAAQYTAKRGGRGRVIVSDTDVHQSWLSRQAERRAIRGLRSVDADVGALLEDTLALLDGAFAGRPTLARLEVVLLAVGEAVDATGVAVSSRRAGAPMIETVFVLDRRADRSGGLRSGSGEAVFAAGEYPDSVRLMTDGGSLHVSIEDPDADPGELQVLRDYGMQGLVAAGTPDGEGEEWLCEVFADALTASLEPVAPALRLLVAEAVRRRHRR
jgi:diguanylate cyclase (GGDEF)-like protein